MKSDAKRSPQSSSSGAGNTPELDQLLTAQEAASLLCVKAQTLAKWRMGVGGYGPVFIKVGRSIRYRRRAIVAFIETNTFDNTVQARYRPRPALKEL